MFPSNHSWVTQDNKKIDFFLFGEKNFFICALFKVEKCGKSLNSRLF
jgi:hypothetical protein